MPGVKQISKEEFEQKISQAVSQACACLGCSFNHYDEDGGNYCGLACTGETTCPRTGGKF